MTDQTTSIPVNVITGFLGSGKTSLLRRLLASPALAEMRHRVIEKNRRTAKTGDANFE